MSLTRKRMFKLGAPCPSEHKEQVALMQWVGWMTPRWPELELLFAIPNGGDRDEVVAAKLKAEGVKKGVPDLMLPVARGEYHGLFVEMKRQEGGREKPEQKEWREKLLAQGYQAVVCRGLGEAMRAISEYMDPKPAPQFLVLK
ncbi:MAG: VRR-NUC domain-containing protein [Humidesulfovibrio sp.]|uniref:VRR-NUC domain-containing protein n=1 Tax=Humidesulfovibrio sp. TaxID=2910988 RepID=UPI0027F43B1E|nr:VRR-NUC domain-containing protein [Humidesulfovibrio sp.]MDQ7835495.1 VRR-NUC domain-containing protein [Humidesulfovibrio sp.]